MHIYLLWDYRFSECERHPAKVGKLWSCAGMLETPVVSVYIVIYVSISTSVLGKEHLDQIKRTIPIFVVHDCQSQWDKSMLYCFVADWILGTIEIGPAHILHFTNTRI